MFLKTKRKGQSTLEYGILIAVVVGALVAMSVYIKRGIQGKLRSSTDDIGEQYSAGKTTSKYETNSTTITKEILESGVTTTTIIKDDRFRKGNETVAGLSEETW
jgi:uncharacterized protein (UPF0333 family)